MGKHACTCLLTFTYFCFLWGSLHFLCQCHDPQAIRLILTKESWPTVWKTLVCTTSCKSSVSEKTFPPVLSREARESTWDLLHARLMLYSEIRLFLWKFEPTSFWKGMVHQLNSYCDNKKERFHKVFTNIYKGQKEVQTLRVKNQFLQNI